MTHTKRKLTQAVSVILLTLTLTAGTVACSATTDVDPKPAATEAATQAPAPEATPTEEPVAEADGSRENPFPYGYQATVTNLSTDEPVWSVTVNQPFDATADISAENPYNSAPENGSYLAVPINIVYHGSEPEIPWLNFEVSFVSEDGNTYESTVVVQPWVDLFDLGELFEGGTADATVVIDIPANTVGTVQVKVGFIETVRAFWG